MVTHIYLISISAACEKACYAPSNMMVAVPVLPFQHSPTFGHCASSHTVCSFRVRSESLKYS